MSSISTDLKDVLNLSLGLLGEDAITDYDNPDSEAGIKMKRFMEFSINEVQRDYLWSELSTQTALLSSDVDYEYDLPTDCLRPLGIRLNTVGVELHPFFSNIEQSYILEGGKLTTYATEPELFYIRSEIDPTKWSSEMEHCITLKLAINSGLLVCDNGGLVQMYEQKYEAMSLPRAKMLQSRKKTNVTKFIPEGFDNLATRNS